MRYIKSSTARERPTICPICFEDVVTHFTRHLFRHHIDDKQVQTIQKLKPRSKERLALVSTLRKQGYFHLKIEKNIENPVKSSKLPDVKYFPCQFCLGLYRKDLLYKHVKICKLKPVNLKNPGAKCLANSQTFMAIAHSKNHAFLKSSRLKEEVFGIMRADEISAVAKSDPLICLCGEALLSKHKRQQSATVVANKIRELARLTIALKTLHPEVKGLFHFLLPTMFQSIILATKMISGYDSETKSFKSASLALHMGTSLKFVCDVAFKQVVENRHLPNIIWTDKNEKKNDIKDLRKLILGHWCNEISSLALKNLKEKQWQKPVLLPTASDIGLFQKYVQNLAEKSFQELNNNLNIASNYKNLAECVLALTIMFNRKRVGDVQYLKITDYNRIWPETNQNNFIESLTSLEKIICRLFKRIVVGGKGSKPVPILFSTLLQKYLTCLIDTRKKYNLVPESNPYVFANVASENRWMPGANIIRKFAKDCGAQNPALLTSTKFRKHIATTLQLMNMNDHEMEQIATFMGHTKRTHAEFYR